MAKGGGGGGRDGRGGGGGTENAAAPAAPVVPAEQAPPSAEDVARRQSLDQNSLTNIAIARSEKMTKSQQMRLILNAEARTAWSSQLLDVLVKRGFSLSQAQYSVLATLHQMGSAQAMTVGNFSWNMRGELAKRLSAFQGKAYPLSQKQYDAAILHAW